MAPVDPYPKHPEHYTLAKIAYKAYGERLHGSPKPFETLTPQEQDAWYEAAAMVCAEVLPVRKL